MKILILIFSFVYLSAGQFEDKILITVGNEIILESDLEVALLQNSSIPEFNSLSEEQKKSAILNQIVDSKVLYITALKDTSILVTETEIETGVNFRLQQMSQQTGGSIKQLEIALQQQGFSLNNFKKQLQTQIKEQILTQKLQSKYLSSYNQTLSSKQIEDFFYQFSNQIPDLKNNVNLSFIEVSVKPNPKTFQKSYQLCDSVIQLLNKSHLPFEDLASQFSDDPSGEDGGDLGFIKAGSIDPAYEAHAFRLDIGEITKKPVLTKFGYHIIKTTDRRDREVQTSHILFLVESTVQDEENTKQKLLNWKKQINSNQITFEEVAKRFSEDKKTRAKNGLLGWFSYENIPPEYKNIADTLEIGKISDPIWIDEKFYLFKVNDKRENRKPSLEDDWFQISQLAQHYYAEHNTKKKIQEWKKAIYIKNNSSVPLENEPLIFNNQ